MTLKLKLQYNTCYWQYKETFKKTKKLHYCIKNTVFFLHRKHQLVRGIQSSQTQFSEISSHHTKTIPGGFIFKE